MSDLAKLRRLAQAVQVNAGDLYGLNWKATEVSDEYGVGPRINLGGNWNATIRFGWWSPNQAPAIRQLTYYIEALTPEVVLTLLNRAEEANDSP